MEVYTSYFSCDFEFIFKLTDIERTNSNMLPNMLPQVTHLLLDLYYFIDRKLFKFYAKYIEFIAWKLKVIFIEKFWWNKVFKIKSTVKQLHSNYCFLLVRLRTCMLHVPLILDITYIGKKYFAVFPVHENSFSSRQIRSTNSNEFQHQKRVRSFVNRVQFISFSCFQKFITAMAAIFLKLLTMKFYSGTNVA